MPKTCKPVQCMTVPNAKVECACELRLDERERFMFDLVAEERVAASSTDVDVFQFNKTKSQFDPLYGEVTTHGWDGPYRLQGIVTGVTANPEVKDIGSRKMFMPVLWIARATFEAAGARAPREADIVRLWSIPHWVHVATRTPPNAIDGFFFNVISVEDDGAIFDTPMFVGFTLGLARNTEFTPERRMYNK